MKQKGIYVIMDYSAGKSYVGSTNDLRRRLREHSRDLNNNKHHNYKLQEAYNNGNDLKVLPIAVTDDVNVTGIEQTLISDGLSAKLLYNINDDTTKPIGMTGMKHSPETLKKLSEIAIAQGRRPSEKALLASIEANRNRVRSNEEIENKRRFQIDRMKDPEARRVSGLAMLNKKHTSKTIAKMKEAAVGRTFTVQAKEAQLKATRGRKCSSEEIVKRNASRAKNKELLLKQSQP